jgi:hypothetical protein
MCLRQVNLGLHAASFAFYMNKQLARGKLGVPCRHYPARRTSGDAWLAGERMLWRERNVIVTGGITQRLCRHPEERMTEGLWSSRRRWMSRRCLNRE